MSSNLYKRGTTLVAADNTRIIDVNQLLAKRLEELKAHAEAEQAFLLANSNSDKQEVDNLLQEDSFSALGDTVEQYEEGQLPEVSVQTEEMSVSAEELLNQAKEEAKQLKDAAIAEAYAEAERIKKEAAEAGKEEGLREAEAVLDGKLKELERKEVQLNDRYESFMQDAESRLIDIMSDIYGKMINVSFAEDKEVLLQVISDALKGIDGSHSFTIRVSPEDYELVRGKQKSLENCIQGKDSFLEILSDNQLSPTECCIETEKGIYDCGLDTQLTEIKKRLVLLSYDKTQ